MPGICQRMGVVGTGGDAIAAGRAFVREKRHFRQRAFSLRVMAPEAVQGTTLEKHGSTDTRAVVQSKALDIKNSSAAFRALLLI